MNGCVLYTILKDVVFAKIDGLDLDKSPVDSLVGIAVVRPRNEEYSEYEKNLVINISYFIDSKVESSAFKVGIEIFLIPYQITVLYSVKGYQYF